MSIRGIMREKEGIVNMDGGKIEIFCADRNPAIKTSRPKNKRGDGPPPYSTRPNL